MFIICVSSFNGLPEIGNKNILYFFCSNFKKGIPASFFLAGKENILAEGCKQSASFSGPYRAANCRIEERDINT